MARKDNATKVINNKYFAFYYIRDSSSLSMYLRIWKCSLTFMYYDKNLR